jgi:hypothetical protein
MVLHRNTWVGWENLQMDWGCQAVALVALLSASACTTRPPAFWKDACATEVGPRRYATPPSDGLALQLVAGGWSTSIASNPELVLLQTGASWVEVNWSAPVVNSKFHYGEGAGRYVIRLSGIRSEACRSALSANGFDPETLEWRGPPRRAAPLGSLEACSVAQRVGDINSEYTEVGRVRSQDSTLAGWNAPYVFLLRVSPDSRSTANGVVQRTARQIVERQTGQPIVEVVSLSFVSMAGNGFPSITVCSGRNGFGYTGEIFPERVFASE